MKRGALLIIITIATVTACTRQVYVPMPSISTTLNDHAGNIFDMERDREREQIRESFKSDTRVTVNDGGDTLRTDTRIIYVRDRELERENEHLRAIVDSMKSIRRDSVPIPYPVEKKLTRWEQVKIDTGGFAIGAVAVIMSFAVIWLVRAWKK